MTECPTCKGSKYIQCKACRRYIPPADCACEEDGSDPLCESCPNCGGSGYIGREVDDDGNRTGACGVCHGSGTAPDVVAVYYGCAPVDAEPVPDAVVTWYAGDDDTTYYQRHKWPRWPAKGLFKGGERRKSREANAARKAAATRARHRR